MGRERGTDYGCKLKYKTMNNGLQNEKEQSKSYKILKNLIYVIHLSTRGSNAVKLLLKKDMAFFLDAEVRKIDSSDQNMIEATIAYCTELLEEKFNTSKDDDSETSDLNFYFDMIK